METVFILVHQLIYRWSRAPLESAIVKIIMHDRSSVRVFGWCHGDTKNYQPQNANIFTYRHTLCSTSCDLFSFKPISC